MNKYKQRGEKDRFISQDLRNKVIDLVKSKSQKAEILKSQDHSPWEYDLCQKIYKEELEILERSFDQ